MIFFSYLQGYFHINILHLFCFLMQEKFPGKYPDQVPLYLGVLAFTCIQMHFDAFRVPNLPQMHRIQFSLNTARLNAPSGLVHTCTTQIACKRAVFMPLGSTGVLYSRDDQPVKINGRLTEAETT